MSQGLARNPGIIQTGGGRIIGRAMAKSRRTVLVIDDNEDFIETTSALIAMWGHRPLTTHDSLAGLELARSAKPDVVLVDIGLPDISGLRIGKQLREDPAFARTLLVAVSANAGRARSRAHAHGFDLFLLKPFEPETLRRVIVAYEHAMEPA